MKTVSKKAAEIVSNGMNKEELFSFFDETTKDIIEYICLFQALGVKQDVVWDIYEEWVDKNIQEKSQLLAFICQQEIER